MTPQTSSLFGQVIQDHLELKKRNARLEHRLPLSNYTRDDPFANNPLFQTEEEARVHDHPRVRLLAHEEPSRQAQHADGWPAARQVLEDTDFWTTSREFDWGD